MSTLPGKVETPEDSARTPTSSTSRRNTCQRSTTAGTGASSSPDHSPEELDQGRSESRDPDRDAAKRDTSAKKEDDKEKKVSCSTCREAKVKCITDEGKDKCRRCLKYESECRFEEHKRGRRKGKIKQHQVNRRFELIARTLEELRTLTRSLQDAAAIALVASLRYQLISSTCIPDEARAILDHSASLGDGDTGFKGKKRTRLEGEGDESSSDDGDDHISQRTDPAMGAINSATAAYSMMDSAAETKSLAVTPRPAPGVYSRSSAFEQHRGSTTRPPAWFPSHSGMINRARGGNGMTDTNRSASLLVEIEDYESVAIVPQAVQTLSNPLKLLAHASDAVDSAARASAGKKKAGVSNNLDASNTGSPHRANAQRHVEPHARVAMEEDELVPLHRRLNKSMDQREAAAWSHFVGSHNNDGRDKRDQKENDSEASNSRDRQGDRIEWSSYFSRGAFHPRYDSGAAIDPIERRFMTVEQAQNLLNFFYDNFGTFIHCFDPNLSTLSYLRKHSAFLISVICSIAAEYHPDPQYSQIAHRLAEYVDEMLPAVMSGVYKSVETAQACHILASYQQMSDSAVDDQTWALLGTSIRIASELGCNLACFSFSAPAGDPALEKHHRQLKNTERLWLSLWIHEKTLASQTGQKLHLAEDPIISSCGTWHQRPYAMPQDEALVAFVDLRRIMDRHAATFHTQILRALTSRSPEGGPHTKKRETGHSEQLMLLVDLFRANVHIDFKRWEESWLTGPNETANPKSPLQCTGILHLHFATLVILSLPLRSTSERPTQDFDALRRDCYGAALGFLSAFVDRSERGLLPCVTNAIAVSAVYCSIFALKLCGLSPDVAPFINTERVIKLAKNLARELQKAGSYPPHRAKLSVPAKFADYLFGYLSRWEAHRSPQIRAISLPSSRRTSGGAMQHQLPAFTPLPQNMSDNNAGSDAGNGAQPSYMVTGDFEGGDHVFAAGAGPGQMASMHAPYPHQPPPHPMTPSRAAAAAAAGVAGIPHPQQMPGLQQHQHQGQQHQHQAHDATTSPWATSANGTHHQQPLAPPPVMGEEAIMGEPGDGEASTSLDDFWKSMTGGNWDNLTGFAPLLDQMAGFDFATSIAPPNAPGGGPEDRS